MLIQKDFYPNGRCTIKMNSIEDTKHTDKFLSWSDTSDLKTVFFLNKCESINCVQQTAIFSLLLSVSIFFYFGLLIWLCVLSLVIVFALFALMALPLTGFFSLLLLITSFPFCQNHVHDLSAFSTTYRTRH